MLSFSRCANWAFVLGLPLTVLGGCSKQGPGERCDTANGSNDCGDGLVCVSKGTLGGNSSLCCPIDQTGPESIVPGCTYGAAIVVQDSGAAQPGDAAPDATGGGPAEAGSDTATADALADAPVTPTPNSSADATTDGSDAAADGSADAATDGSADAATDGSADAAPDAAADGSAADGADDAG